MKPKLFSYDEAVGGNYESKKPAIAIAGDSTLTQKIQYDMTEYETVYYVQQSMDGIRMSKNTKLKVKISVAIM